MRSHSDRVCHFPELQNSSCCGLFLDDIHFVTKKQNNSKKKIIGETFLHLILSFR